MAEALIAFGGAGIVLAEAATARSGDRVRTAADVEEATEAPPTPPAEGGGGVGDDGGGIVTALGIAPIADVAATAPTKVTSASSSLSEKLNGRPPPP